LAIKKAKIKDARTRVGGRFENKPAPIGCPIFELLDNGSALDFVTI
jgi:hypothetical protein